MAKFFGLLNPVKRKRCLSWLKSQNADVAFLQDVHLDFILNYLGTAIRLPLSTVPIQLTATVISGSFSTTMGFTLLQN